MNMKNALILTLAALIATTVPSGAIAEEEPPPPPWSVTVEVSASETFLADYNGLIWFDGPVIQTSTTIAHSSGFYLNLWTSTGTDGKWSADWDDELDVNVGWAGPVGLAGIQADLSVGYWDCFQVGSPQNDYTAANIIFSRPFEMGKWKVTPSALAQFVWAVTDETVMADGTVSDSTGGSVWGVNVKIDRDLCRFAAASATTGVYFDGGSFGYEDAVIWESALSLDWKIGERLKLSLPSLRVSSPLASTDRDTVWVWGAVLTWTF